MAFNKVNNLQRKLKIILAKIGIGRGKTQTFMIEDKKQKQKQLSRNSCIPKIQCGFSLNQLFQYICKIIDTA